MLLLTILFFVISLVAYGGQVSICVHKHLTQSQQFQKLGICFALGGLVFQSAFIGCSSVLQAGTQLQGANVLMLISWACALAYLILLIAGKRAYGDYLIVCALAFELISSALGLISRDAALNEVYQSWPYLVVHVACYMISASLFLITGIASILALLQDKNLKNKEVSKLKRYPGLSALKQMGRNCVLIGMPLYSVGLILGILRAVHLVELWFLSPRVLLAGALWFVVLLYLFQVYVLRASTASSSKTGVALAALTLILAVLSASIPMFLPAQFLST